MAATDSGHRRRSSGFDFEDDEDLQIDNPVIHKSLDKIKAEAHELADLVDEDRPDHELFEKAALIARDPKAFRSVDGLTPTEEAALDREKSLNFWQQPKQLIRTIALLSLSALTQGWIESTSNVANLTWPAQLGVDNKPWPQYKWIFGAVNAITYISGAICALLFADPCMLVGRRGVIAISGCFCLIGAVGSAWSQDWKMLMAFRTVLGMGFGAKAGVTAVFAAEVAPSHMRGRIVMTWQLFVATGIAAGFLAASIVYHIEPGKEEDHSDSQAWRWQTASVLVPLISMLTLSGMVSESPRYLLKKGKLTEAFAALCELRETPLQAARDLYFVNAQIQLELALLPGVSNDADPAEQADEGIQKLQKRIRKVGYWTRLFQLFRDKRTGRATLASSIVMISQQLCGINVIMFYSSNILRFKGVNLDGSVPYWLNFGLGCANVVGTLPAFFMIDSRGRRFLLLTMYPIMTLAMLASGLSFQYPGLDSDAETTRAALLLLFMLIFVLSYSVGQGPVAYTYASEVFPLAYREIGFGFSVFANLLGCGLISLFVPQIQLRNGDLVDHSYRTAQTWLLAAFAIMNLTANILVFFFVPETSGTVFGPKQGKINAMSLEQLNYIFGVRVWRHAKYQAVHMLPWILRKGFWLLCRSLRIGGTDPGDPDIVWKWAEPPSSGESEQSGSETEVGSDHGSGSSVELRVFDSRSRSRDQGQLEAEHSGSTP